MMVNNLRSYTGPELCMTIMGVVVIYVLRLIRGLTGIVMGCRNETDLDMVLGVCMIVTGVGVQNVKKPNRNTTHVAIEERKMTDYSSRYAKPNGTRWPNKEVPNRHADHEGVSEDLRVAINVGLEGNIDFGGVPILASYAEFVDALRRHGFEIVRKR